MDRKDCIYPDCQQVTDFGNACQHSCPYEGDAKAEDRQHPGWRNCLANEVAGASCQFPKCDC